jgi:two-component system, cell cycle response regulator
MVGHDEEEITAERRIRPITAPAYARVPALLVVSGPELGRVYRVDTALVIGRGDDVDVPILDPKVSRRHAIVRMRQRVVWLEDLGSKNGTFVNGAPAEKRILEAGDRIELGPRAALKYELFDAEELTLSTRIYDASALDELTGTFNRRYFDDRLHAEASYAKRHASGIAILLVELEGYEGLMDRHGADAADRALVHVAHHVRRRLRPEYALARYAGTRFALLCPGISLDEAASLEREISETIARHGLELPRGAEALELRIGWAHAHGGSPELADLLVARAQRALTPAEE